MGQLHEVLAARTKREEESQKAINDASKIFSAPHLFEAFQETYRHLEDDPAGVHKQAPKGSFMTTTVPEVLEQFQGQVSPYIDLMFVVDRTNMEAVAKVNIDGLDLPELPTTQLLALEKRVKDIRKVFEAIPTHDPKMQWKDDAERLNVSKTDSKVSYVTTKRSSWDVVVEPTKEHPAIVKERTEDPIVGERTKVYWSSKLTHKQHAALLKKCDELATQIHVSLAKANQVEAKNGKIAGKLFDWLLDGIISK